MRANSSAYIHGTNGEEQARLSLLNDLLNVGSLRELGLQGGERILDVGRRLGRLALATVRKAGQRVVAVERSAEQIAEAERQSASVYESALVEFRLGDARHLPLRDEEWGTFDVAHTRFLLEHLREPRPVVEAMVRAVRPGRRIVIEEDDHDLLRLWPEPPQGFADLWSAYQHSFRHLGNDHTVGRRLVGLFTGCGHGAGAQHVRLLRELRRATEFSAIRPEPGRRGHRRLRHDHRGRIVGRAPLRSSRSRDAGVASPRRREPLVRRVAGRGPATRVNCTPVVEDAGA